MDERAYQKLIDYLTRIPAVIGKIGAGSDGTIWWVKFAVDLNHKFAWHTIQELGHVLNYLSVEERLPTRFYPVSPPPYMNGGPKEFLSWVIECNDIEFKPGSCANWLEERLPQPVEDLNQWNLDNDI